MKLQELLDKEIDAMEITTLVQTLRKHLIKGAFDIPDKEKLVSYKKRFMRSLDILGMDLTDDSLKGTLEGC
ncbi:MAG: hypothetical protein CM15mP102_11490 [Flavobacteriales bacterium]|nr:MAG: hypothetical protein CM15mP102_11490 [Flavobacteriales bacterium]